jgi:hypothetical protein
MKALTDMAIRLEQMETSQKEVEKFETDKNILEQEILSCLIDTIRPYLGQIAKKIATSFSNYKSEQESVYLPEKGVILIDAFREEGHNYENVTDLDGERIVLTVSGEFVRIKRTGAARYDYSKWTSTVETVTVSDIVRDYPASDVIMNIEGAITDKICMQQEKKKKLIEDLQFLQCQVEGLAAKPD